jgi:ABC-2 type transport system permease protein
MIPTHIFGRSTQLAFIFIKEQIKEPTAFFWTLLSPAAIFYLLNYTRGRPLPFESDYMETTSWFYAYIASNVALFGLAFYIIGRRESGYIRSFVYTVESRVIFLIAKLMAYSCISIFYCVAFYCLTRVAFGTPDIDELYLIGFRFYCCFLCFSIPALLLTLLPCNFQGANTLFSILSFTMLILGIYGANMPQDTPSLIHLFNPLWFAEKTMSQGILQNPGLVVFLAILFALNFALTTHKLRINPVWSRY